MPISPNFRPTFRRLRCALAFVLALAPISVSAAASPEFTSVPATARLITAQNGIAPGTGTLSAGLHVNLGPGWKTYWKSPGEVGIPPRLVWDGSENIADIRFLWPSPMRFRAFGIENFGYKEEVVFPLQLILESPGQPADLRAQVSLLVCSEVCVPLDFELSLALGADATTDEGSAALIADFARRVPDDGSASGISVTSAHVDEDLTRLVIAAQADRAFVAPDVFPDMGLDVSFGPPDLRIGDRGRRLWASFPILSARGDPAPPSVTITDGSRAAEFTPPQAPEPAPPPYRVQARGIAVAELAAVALVALLGGMILNVMPCVLPVLSIKLSSALRLRDAGPGRVRAGFLASAAGVMALMWLLAGLTIAARTAGLSVGWGLQFQNPIFLIVMLGLVTAFAANLFGLFEIALPQSWNSRLARAGAKGGLAGDFATGAFVAILATPCSAPFLGTAVAFALSGRPIDIAVIFTALGLGLALPYLLIAARPGWIAALPRPGRWMLALKWLMGALLAVTAAWLLWVLAGVAGRDTALAAATLIGAAILLIRIPPRLPALLRTGAASILAAGAIAAPAMVAVPETSPSAGPSAEVIPWVAFDRPQIARLVSRGQVVFVDVTADWCLTCKANKALVIDRGAVTELLSGGTVVPMRADWTRPDEAIRRYLQDNGRFGIPFNIVYGPSAPEGIALPEVLSTETVLDALERAGAETALSATDSP